MNMPNYGIVKNNGKNKQGKNKDIHTKNNTHSKQGKRKRRVDKRGKECQGEIKRRKGILVGRAASPLSRDIFTMLCF